MGPLLDVLLTRTPNVFVRAGEPTAAVVERIGAAAAGMGPGDALLIFPEGATSPRPVANASSPGSRSPVTPGPRSGPTTWNACSRPG